MSTGDIAQGDVVVLGFFKLGVLHVATFKGVLATLLLDELPFDVDGLSSLDFLLLSDDLGTKKAVGEVDGVMFVAPIELFLDALPFDPPFRSLL
jgi:hypothetical protein